MAQDKMSGQEPDVLAELELEATLGGEGVDDDSRTIPLIDLQDFELRFEEIADQLWTASCNDGFFQLVNHGVPVADIEEAFTLTEEFFSLPVEARQALALQGGSNAGWESRSQVRPSTKTNDQKESYQITLPRMSGLWPDGAMPAFRPRMLAFEHQAWALGMRVLSCFAWKLGFERGFFTAAHDPASADYQSTLRLLHYFPTGGLSAEDRLKWRAGAHTDFDCLTLLFQRTGQDGLQLCPGNRADSGAWTSVAAATDRITCNIGDMLMRWSDDQLKSTLHRVRMPRENEYQGSRYSIAFFCQANRDITIQGPQGKYAPVTAHDYLQQRIAANFSY